MLSESGKLFAGLQKKRPAHRSYKSRLGSIVLWYMECNICGTRLLNVHK